MDGRLGPEDLVDPTGRHRAARDQDEHEHRREHREQDLQQVLQEGRQIADLQCAVGDPDGPEPDHGDRREVEDRGHHRDREREEPADLELGIEEVAAGRLEPALLVPGPHEGSDDADARERLAHDLVDAVELGLR